jgi:membrane-associated phospholipid phosphatase
MKVKVYHNGDDVFIAWKPDGFIPSCRGFALLRPISRASPAPIGSTSSPSPTCSAHNSPPQTAALFARVIATANFVTSGLKDHYQRPGLFVAHPDQVQLLVRNEPGYSYPSGHTTRGRLCALVLADLDPSRRGLIVPAAERVGIDRIMAGEHYQTDIAAGRRLAKILFQILDKNQQFQAELATVKAAEWTTPPSPPPTPKTR